MWMLRDLRAALRHVPDRVVNVTIGLTLAAVDVLGLWVIGPADVGPERAAALAGPSVIGVAVALLANVPVVARVRFPTLVLAVIGLTHIAAVPLGVPLQGFGLVVALYSVALHAPRRDAYIALACVGAGMTVSLVLADAFRFAFTNVVVLGAAWILGDQQRTRRAYTSTLEERAAQLEREREDRTRLAVAGERARIARELHDVIAHTVSVMVVQATAARRLLSRDTDRADAALRTVESTGREALGEMRTMLGVLRAEGDAPAADLAPQPGLYEIEDLVAEFRRAGLPVELDVQGEPRPLPAAADLSAYRVAQEALTNALKHARARRVRVRLDFRSGFLLEVTDDGRGPERGRDGSGHGLVGMRERATMIGADLQVGARPGGGFRVALSLPERREGVPR